MFTSPTQPKEMRDAIEMLNKYYTDYVSPLISFELRPGDIGWHLYKITDDGKPLPSEEELCFCRSYQDVLLQVMDLLEEGYYITEDGCI